VPVSLAFFQPALCAVMYRSAAALNVIALAAAAASREAIHA
jgi:hypothetical protein